MLFAIDVETACAVPECPHHGRSLCANGHSLSPWHSRITVAAAVSEDGTSIIARHPNPAALVSALKSEIERMSPDYTVVGQNFKFDWLHLARHGFEIPVDRWVGDSQLAAYVLTEKIPNEWLEEYEAKRLALGKTTHRKASKHSLKTLAPYFLNVEPFWEPEHDHDDDAYVLKDAKYTLDLVRVLEQRLKDRGEYQFYKDCQLPWTKMLLAAEWRGIRIDMAALAEKETVLKERSYVLKAELDGVWAEAHAAYRKILEAEVIARYGRMKKIKPWAQRRQAALDKVPLGFSYDSPSQMAWLLRDYLGYDIRSLEGSDSTAREVLERLAEEGKDDVKTYLEWRKTNKLLTAFIPTYKELAVVDKDGNHVLHPIFNPDTTRTGRTSSERPNVQQVPPALRPLLVPRAGYKFVGYDAAAIEAKLIALYSDDPTLYSIIDTGISLHDHNTKVFFSLGEEVPYSDVKTKFAHERSASKNVGFALFYNAGANRIRIAFAQKGYHLTETQCRELHKRFKESYAAAIAYGKEVVKFMEDGNVLPNLLGRPLRIEDPDDAYMQALNTLIQSSASDLLLEGAFRASKQFTEAGIDAHPLLFVHDFVAFEVREDQVQTADEILVNALTDFDLVNSNGRIKLEVDGGIMDRWEK